MQQPSAPPMEQHPALDVQLSDFSSHQYATTEIKSAPAAQETTRARIDGPTQNPR